MKNGRPPKGVDPHTHPFVIALAEGLEFHNMTWAQLAKEARLDERTLRRWRNGDTGPSLRDIERALAVVDIEITLMSEGGRGE